MKRKVVTVENGKFHNIENDVVFMSAPKSSPCSVCFTPSTLKCSRCKVSFYCSVDCQRKDWAVHKNTCDLVSSITKPQYYKAPTPDSKYLEEFDRLSDETRIPVLSNMKDTIWKLRQDRLRATGIIFSEIVGQEPEEIIEINKRIDVVAEVLYNYNSVIELEKEESNGYTFPSKRFTLPYDIYLEWVSVWNDHTEMSFEQFYEEYDDTACTGWSKMDEHGESFGGFWKRPEDSLEYKNAWDLTRRANGEALYRLPFNKKFVLYTIKLGCQNHGECVRYSNFLCEIMSRFAARQESQGRDLVIH